MTAGRRNTQKEMTPFIQSIIAPHQDVFLNNKSDRELMRQDIFALETYLLQVVPQAGFWFEIEPNFFIGWQRSRAWRKIMVKFINPNTKQINESCAGKSSLPFDVLTKTHGHLKTFVERLVHEIKKNTQPE